MEGNEKAKIQDGMSPGLRLDFPSSAAPGHPFRLSLARILRPAAGCGAKVGQRAGSFHY